MLDRRDLYFFLYPPSWVAQAAAQLWQAALAGLGHQPCSRPMQSHRLHLTLQKLGQFEGPIPHAAVDLALAAGVRMEGYEPFAVCLDRLRSRATSANARHGMVELTGAGPGVRDLRAFQRELGQAMRQAGFAESQILDHFTPHMTLDYGLGGVKCTTVAPLAWVAADFALVESLYGRSHHNVLARWPLVARQQSFFGQ